MISAHNSLFEILNSVNFCFGLIMTIMMMMVVVVVAVVAITMSKKISL
jgi:hypothetical protein